MNNIVLISCCSKKRYFKTKAQYLYFSPLFCYSLRYAKKLMPYKIFILSAKHGLIDLNKEIEPYNETLNKKSKNEIKEWAKEVKIKLEKESNLQQDKFIFLAGEKYRKYLIPFIKNYEIPLKGLGIGSQLKYLKDKL